MKEAQMFSWIEFYQKFAKKLLEYREARPELIRKLKNVFAECKKNHPEIPPRKNGEHEEHVFDFPRLEKDESDPNLDIDPFTVFGFFNKGLNPENRSIIIRGILKEFDLDPGLEPIDFDAIPIVYNQRAVFFRWRDGDDKGRNKRGAEDINHLWELFFDAMLLAENENEANEKQFAVAFDSVVRNGESSIGKVSMGLFWIAPAKFIALDKKNLALLYKEGKLSEGIVLKGKREKVALADVHGEDYLTICKAVKGKLEVENRFKAGFAEFSYAAEQYAKTQTKKEEGDAMMENNETTSSPTTHPLNQILFGPPGTGKTYNTIIRAVEIIEGKDSVENKTYEQIKERFTALKDQRRIGFVTFHQSYGYEDFIDGIKPVCDEMSEDDERETSEIRYKRQAGVFRRFCLDAMQTDARLADGELISGLGNEPRIWKVSLNGTGENPVRSECLKNGHIRVGFDEVGEFPEKSEIKKGRFVLKALYERMKVGDIVLSCYSSEEIDAIGVVTGKDVRWDNTLNECKRVRDVRWVWVANREGEKENIVAINQNKRFTLSTVYETRILLSDVLRIVAKHQSKENVNADTLTSDQRYVFIIDEINRGNISKIFGELITLIEESKRIGNANELRVKLPNAEDGEEDFGVPNNVYIIGTMNTADRSIAMLDTALRRRFEFIEMMPRPELLKDIKIVDDQGKDTSIEIVRMFIVMNARIEVLLDREHQIGHAYFLEALKEHPTIENLGKLFRNKIIPLLQEYFYDDYEKIRMVLGDGRNDGDFAGKNNKGELDFIEKISMNDGNAKNLFRPMAGVDDIIGDEKCVYHVKSDGVYSEPLAYQKIYKGVTLPFDQKHDGETDEKKGVSA